MMVCSTKIRQLLVVLVLSIGSLGMGVDWSVLVAIAEIKMMIWICRWIG